MLLKELIADYLKENNLSYRAFAQKCGISSAYLSMIISGNNPSTGKAPVVSYPKLAMIAKGMDMSTHNLFDVVDDMPIDISESKDTFSASNPHSLSDRAMEVARAYDSMSSYGKSLIDKIVENEKKYKIMKAVPLIGEAILDGSVETKEAAKREQRELSHEEIALNSEKI